MLGLGGLRARIVAALVVTDVLTLVVTGVALLGPLDRRLRNDAVASLHDATLAARPGIADVLRADPSTSDLERAARSLRRRTGGEVAIFAADQRLTFYNAAYRALWSLEPAFLDSAPSDSAVLDQLRGARQTGRSARYARL